MIFASNFTELDYSNKSILSSAVIRFVAISTNFNYSMISLFFIIYDRLKLNNQLSRIYQKQYQFINKQQGCQHIAWRIINSVLFQLKKSHDIYIENTGKNK
ncbi:Hypothetical_protein [Hexamita inflata]|uniref:Hypothetical_protein n=1 Tax=Hexamita inflata TaxID=28002 RepID=A0AA86Q3C6_9EUKA|nr:Hypothetical protein HINF_LOCUS39169 [Hexamita inflata]